MSKISGSWRLWRLAFVLVLLFPIGAPDVDAQTAFYMFDVTKLAAEPPGTLLRSEPIDGAPDGAVAYRVLYTSTGIQGEPIAVSGGVIIPAGRAPAHGRPIIAWAHPTTGIVSPCAPSLARVLFASIQGLDGMLRHGDIVTATDYPGLGTPGPHPYLVGVSEGRAILDSVRVARTLPNAHSTSSFAVWGHSQGGQAALFAGILAKSYAPELHLVGIAAVAPATDLATLMNDDMNTSGGRNITAMTLWSWSRVYDVPLSNVVRPAAMPAVDKLAGECIERFFDIAIRHGPTKALGHGFLATNNVTSLQPWRSLLAANSPGTLPPEIPVFLAQGTADHLVLPFVTYGYMKKLCKAGSAVEMYSMPGVRHAFVGRDSATAAVEWMTNRFAGMPPPNDCDQGSPR